MQRGPKAGSGSSLTQAALHSKGAEADSSAESLRGTLKSMGVISTQKNYILGNKKYIERF